MSTQEYDSLWESIIEESHEEQRNDVDCFNAQRDKINNLLYGGSHL